MPLSSITSPPVLRAALFFNLFFILFGEAACQQPPDTKGGKPIVASGNVLPLDGGIPFAYLHFKVTDEESGQLMPSRVIFRPPPKAGFADSVTTGEYDVQSLGSFTGADVSPGVVGSPEGVLLTSGEGLVPVPAGRYDLFITRGPEYEAASVSLSLAEGELRPLEVTLAHSVDTRGWLGADMHVHTQGSYDSSMPRERRVVSMVTNGIEIIVPTEHHSVTDLGPAIARLGYGADDVGAIPGDELNFKEGHAGVYPVVYEPTKRDHGGFSYQKPNENGRCDRPLFGINCFSSVEAFEYMHYLVPDQTVVTINHPFWPDGDLGYFTNIDWGSGRSGLRPLETAPHIDALEVLNGYWTRLDVQHHLLVDWLYLLSQGFRITALGNSDTHKINWIRSGWPRTWLRLPIDRPGEITGQLLADAIRHQRAIASNGPFISFHAGGADIGDTVRSVDGRIEVEIEVDAPAWIDVSEVRLLVGGVEHNLFTVTDYQRPRFHVKLTIYIEKDTFLVVLATGTKPLPGDVVGEASHTNGWEMLPFALTNPIFVDADGDGKCTPSPNTETLGPQWGSRIRNLIPAPLRKENDQEGPLRVPVDCDPRHSTVEEDPLPPSPAGQLMPLLYP